MEMLEGAKGVKAPDVCMLVWVLAVWGQLAERYVLRALPALLEPLRTQEVRSGARGTWRGCGCGLPAYSPDLNT